MEKYITDFYPDKAQFNSGEEVKLLLEVQNKNTYSTVLSIVIYVLYLGKTVESINKTIQINDQQILELEFLVSGKDEFYKGYGADVYIYEENKLIDTASTAFDVVDSYKRAVRYGFLSDFYLNQQGSNEDMKSMCKLHLNVIQFYDWMYKHDSLIAKQDLYMDLMGRTLSAMVVKEKISKCHEYGMQAIAYGAVYAASKEFYEKHKDWALYDSCNKALCFIDIFYIMNISIKSPWHSYIINQYKEAIIEMDFNGIHMDTYGFPKTARSGVGANNELVYLDEELPKLINNTKQELTKIKKDCCIIMNNVGNWPVRTTAITNQDAVYVEVWSPYERYFHLASIIKDIKMLNKDKSIILAAYMKAFIEKDTSLSNAQNAELIAFAVISSYGAFQLIFGEDKGILTQGYYVDYTSMSKEYFNTVKKYCDFIVRYSNILYDRNLIDVSMTHTGGDNKEYIFEGCEFSSYGEPNKVWTIIHEDKQIKVIKLINLVGNDEDYWSKGKSEPNIVTNIEIKIMLDKRVKNIYTASPDYNNCREEELEYKEIDGIRGKNLLLRVPDLKFWRLIWIEFAEEI